MSFMVKILGSENQDYQMIGAKVYPSRPSGFPHSSLLFQSKTKMFRNFTKHRVVAVQEMEPPKEDLRFKLWEGTDYTESKEAFNTIQTTLAPLLNNSSVLFTKSLLKEIILPYPKNPSKICSHLVDVMDTHPDTHPEWLDVIQALLNKSEEPPPMDPTLQQQYISALKRKFQSSACNSVTNLMTSIPLVAVPSIVDEDQEESDKVWTFFRRGTLFSKKDSSSNVADQKNDEDIKTWLIESVTKERYKSCMNLVLCRVNTNNQHPSTGDTALHVAVRKGNLLLVKLLLAYQADPTIANACGETPLKAASVLTCKFADEIVTCLTRVRDLQEQAKLFHCQNQCLPRKQTDSGVFLLSLDGGGMKAVITCHILAAIEARMKELDPSCQSLMSYFDYVAGTSSGAIISGLLSYNPNIAVSNAGMHLYKFMNEVFRCEKSERMDKLKEFIIDVVGKSTVLSDLPQGRNMIITATIANTSPSKLHLMTSYGGKREPDLPGPGERKVWEALVASSAAPTYFPAFDCFLDGGLMANNPTLAAMADIYEQAKTEQKEIKLGFVLSIGTGHVQNTHPVGNYEVYIPGFSFEAVKTLFHTSMGMVRLMTHFAHQSTKCNGEAITQAIAWCDSIGAAYHRLSPSLEQDVPPDMHSVKELVDLIYETELFVLQEHKKINEIANIILNK